jgi:hypothetical protein
VRNVVLVDVQKLLFLLQVPALETVVGVHMRLLRHWHSSHSNL